MANPWPKSTKAVRKQEASNWELGDALSEEFPPSDNGVKNDSYAKIKEFTDFLYSSYGIIRAVNTLRDVRDICLIFPADAALRGAGLDWSIYKIFRGCPDLLRDWVKDHEGESMTANAAQEIATAHKTSLEAAATRGEEDEEDEEETTLAENSDEGEDESSVIEETSETDEENSEEETQPLAAKDEETSLTEEEWEPEPETEEEAEMRLSAEKRAKEEAARCKTEDLKTVAQEIGRFVQNNADISIAWNREAQENLKVVLKDLNWTLKQLKSREKGLVDATAPKPSRRSRSKPNGVGEQQSAVIH